MKLYRLTKQNGLARRQGTTPSFFKFWLKHFISGPKSYRDFRETGPSSHRIVLVHQHGHCFIVLKQQYGVKTLYSSCGTVYYAVYKAGLTLKSVDNYKIKKGNQSINLNLLNSTFLGFGTNETALSQSLPWPFFFLGGWGGGYLNITISPLSPKSDQYQNSPSDINAL